MYKKWTIEEIKNVIDELSEKWNLPCEIPIEISKRAKKRMGAFFYKRLNGKIEPVKFVFAYDLINGNFNEKIVREVITHEFVHYYCDVGKRQSNGHNKYFKEMCIKNGISPETTFKYKSESNHMNYKYKIYCNKCGNLVCQHARKDAAYRKLNYYKSKCCNSKLHCKVLE